MNPYVPIQKRSKKARRLLNLEHRGTWNGVNPVTRVEKHRKAYHRPRMKRETRQLACA
ncbi:MAG: hypothetical protein VZQ75_07045 [Candidatus Faecousia sp.]|nr:hypothetical protein [Candidatus Faecousia sp.]